MNRFGCWIEACASSGAYWLTKLSAAPGTCQGFSGFFGAVAAASAAAGSGGGAAPIMSGGLQNAAPARIGRVRDEATYPGHGHRDLEDVTPGCYRREETARRRNRLHVIARATCW